VGIGTTTPYAQLSITSGNAATTTLALRPASSQTANILDIYNSSGVLTSVINASGNVGIGTTSPWRTFSVAGTAAFSGLVNDSTGYYVCLNTSTYQLATSTSACGASSERFKENIQPLTYGLSAVEELRPVSFTYKTSYINGAGPQIGFIAEEVANVIPELVARGADGTINGLDYPKFVAVIVKAIQDMAQSFTTILLNATTVKTQNLCVGNTCLTELELKDLLEHSGQTVITNNTPTPSSNTEASSSEETFQEESASDSTEETIQEEQPAQAPPAPEESSSELAPTE
jgi:hypothetical protein